MSIAGSLRRSSRNEGIAMMNATMRLTAALSFLLLAGCITSKQPNVVFLGSGIELQTIPGSSSMRAWASRPGALRDYRAFLFEPVVVMLGKPDPGKQVSAEELKELGTHVRDAFVGELARGGYRVVEVPGDGVLRVR